MKFLYKLEKKFGRYAIDNLSIKIVACFGIAYALWLIIPGFYEQLIFDPIYVFGGHQYWRIFTWILTIPGRISVFTILMLFVYASIGTSVERSVGSFLYNIYIFGAVILLTITQFVTGLISYLKTPEFYDACFDYSKSQGVALYGQDMLGIMSDFGPTYLISLSVFLGFALVFSDAMLLFFFVLPIKASWFAVADIVYLIYVFINASKYESQYLYGGTILRGNILAILINFFAFYLLVKNYRSFRRFNPSSDQLKRRKVYRQTVREHEEEYKKPNGITRHKCAICGRSEKDGDDLEFRFCSKCNGNYEYCNEHLFTHEHIK